MIALACGALPELISVVYNADMPLMLHGKHGVGKSEIIVETARLLGLECRVRDLSIMEPPDLAGMPYIGPDRRTHFSPPAFLPSTGRGFLVFEELNRTRRDMIAPCLQLLTARTLNDYTLPTGWVPMAAVNDAAEGYATEELDQAVLSRFLHVQVMPDVEAWVTWARKHQVHERIIAFVEHSPDVFADPQANPRAWTYASNVLVHWEHSVKDETMLATLLAGVLGDQWALSFIQTYLDNRRPLQAQEILTAYPIHRAVLRQWRDGGHLDTISASIALLKRHIQPQRVCTKLVQDEPQCANVAAFLADIPADLQGQFMDWLSERGFDDLRAILLRSVTK
jgi:hypothetical protein